MKTKVIEFLSESNAIEGVYDEDSLNQALIAWEYLITQKEMTLGVVLKTHKILMLHQPGLMPNERGYFREVPVYIGGKEALNHLQIRERLENWCTLMNQPMMMHAWKDLHIDYEKIHPFVDGNGRTGRMFMNWQRVQNNQPLIIIHEGDEQMEYYKWFKV